MKVSVITFAAGLLALLLAFTARTALAATTPPTDLRATIRAELLSDPRTSTLTQTQLDAMVDLLTTQAQNQGVTAADIQRQVPPPAPISSTAQGTMAVCQGTVSCAVDEALGFVGPDTTIPFALGAASMGLLWILAEMIHRRKHPMMSAPVASAGM